MINNLDDILIKYVFCLFCQDHIQGLLEYRSTRDQI